MGDDAGRAPSRPRRSGHLDRRSCRAGSGAACGYRSVAGLQRQPIASQDGSVWLTFNGEIYNFADIRADLEQLGYVFRSHGDAAEVIANGWHAWGPRVFDRMRSMFAVARCGDQRSRRLILARDRFGKKPLYYSPTPAGLLFGSEIKALLTWPGLARTPNLTAIDHYLSLQYVPAPETAFTKVFRVPAAHYLGRSVSWPGGPVAEHGAEVRLLALAGADRRGAQPAVDRGP